MKYQDLIKQIRKNEIGKVYLFAGPEVHVAMMMEKMLVDAAVTPELAQLNYQVFENKSPEIQTVIEACETLPLMSERRIVVMRSATGIMKSADKGVIAALENYLAHPSPTTTLIIYDDHPDQRKKLFKLFKAADAVVSFEQFTRPELVTWLSQRVKRAGKRVDRHTIETFIDQTGYFGGDKKKNETTVAKLDNELSKVIDYVGEGEIISAEDVLTVLPKSIEDTVFAMLDYAIGGNKGAALTLLREFYVRGESPIGIFSLLVRQIRQMLQLRLLQAEKTPRSAIAQEVGVSDFILKKIEGKSRRFSVEKLTAMMTEAAELDFKMKTGGVEAAFGVEWYILSI